MPVDEPRNTIKVRLGEGRPATVGWMWIPSPLVAEVMAVAGFDAIGLDLQHGAIDFGDLYPLMAIISAAGVTPLVRVPSNDRASITRVLDAGAYGVICPDVQNREEAEAFVDACRYPPVGSRGFGPVRPAIGRSTSYAGKSATYPTESENAEVMTIVQIESPLGLENVDAIVATDGLDAIFPGPNDFTLAAYGETIGSLDDPRLREPLQRIIEAAATVDKPVGLLCASPAEVPDALEMGAAWVQLGTDLGVVTAGSQAAVKIIKDAIANRGATANLPEAKA